MRGSAQLHLEAATSSVESLTDSVPDARCVIVARVFDFDELRDVSTRSDGIPVVALLADARREALRAVRMGAAAVLPLDADREELGAAVAGVFRGLLVIPSGTAWSGDSHSELAALPEPLTAREVEILRLLAAGDSNKTIAARLSISVHTVKHHISSILTKLGVSSRTEAVALGLKLGLVLL